MRERFQNWLLRDIQPMTPDQVLAYRPEHMPANQVDDLLVIDRVLQVRRCMVAIVATAVLLLTAVGATAVDIVQADFLVVAPLAVLPLYVFTVREACRWRQYSEKLRHAVIHEPLARDLAVVAYDPATAKVVLAQHAAEGRPVTLGLLAAILMCRPVERAA